MSRIIVMAYGLISYILGVASLVLFILFANNHIGMLLPDYMSLGIDHANTAPTSPAMAFAINVGLIALFGLQHTVMARQSFKSRLVALLPKAAERSTYVLLTAVVILVMVQYWQPMTGSIWLVEGETARMVITGIFYFGWAFTLAATYMLNHNHLFGLQQSFKPHDPDAGAKEFVTPMFYKIVRHPIQTGVLIGMLATPDMTVGRATLAAGMIVYILIGLYYEERDLLDEFGDTYRDYKARVGGLLPRLLK